MIACNSEQFLLALRKTVSWCNGKIDASQPKSCLRSDELRTIIEKNGQDPNAVWNSSRLISDVLQERDAQIVEQTSEKIDGRVLLCAYDYTNHNALTDSETEGYFDEHDNPPWDTWICEIPCLSGLSSKSDYRESWPPNIGSALGDGGPFEVILAAWVPKVFIGAVDRAIEVECVGMLLWADSKYPESPLAPKYNEVLPLWLQEMYEVNKR